MNLEEVIEDLWCNCGLDNPEPKYHRIDCTYRVGWEDYKGCVHMLKSEVTVAEDVTGWKALSMKQYHPDFLDEIFMQRTEDATTMERGKNERTSGCDQILPTPC